MQTCIWCHFSSGSTNCEKVSTNIGKGNKSIFYRSFSISFCIYNLFSSLLGTVLSSSLWSVQLRTPLVSTSTCLWYESTMAIPALSHSCGKRLNKEVKAANATLWKWEHKNNSANMWQTAWWKKWRTWFLLASPTRCYYNKPEWTSQERLPPF